MLHQVTARRASPLIAVVAALLLGATVGYAAKPAAAGATRYVYVQAATPAGADSCVWLAPGKKGC